MDNERVLKLFYPAFALAQAYEYAIVSTVDALDLGAPHVYGEMERDGRPGIIYEYVHGETMFALLTRNPMAIRRAAKRMAAAQCLIHTRHSGSLPDMKDWLRRHIQEAPLIDDTKRNALLAHLDTLPGGGCVCHFDFHPGNVMISGERNVPIDWNNACAGNPAADICRTILMITCGGIPADTPAMLRRSIENFRASLSRQYLSEVERLSGIGADDVSPWMPVIAAARLSEKIEGEAQTLLNLIDTME